jgi:hypothetical protein
MGDNVNHPEHYQNIAGVEAIDILNDVVKDLPGKQAAMLWNAMKYLFRFQKKNGVEDLKKARNYLDYLIADMDAIGAKELTTENNCATFSLLFETNDGAREFLDSLIKAADRDKLITVAYLYAVIGKEPTLNDYSYGWERKDLNYVLTHSHNRMYGLEMPKPRPIKDIIKETTGEDWYDYF